MAAAAGAYYAEVAPAPLTVSHNEPRTLARVRGAGYEAEVPAVLSSVVRELHDHPSGHVPWLFLHDSDKAYAVIPGASFGFVDFGYGTPAQFRVRTTHDGARFLLCELCTPECASPLQDYYWDDFENMYRIGFGLYKVEDRPGGEQWLVLKFSTN